MPMGVVKAVCEILTLAGLPRAAACYRERPRRYAEAGYPICRAPIDFQEEATAHLEGPQVCSDLNSGRWIRTASPRGNTASPEPTVERRADHGYYIVWTFYHVSTIWSTKHLC